MDQKEFDLLMSGSKHYSTSWESALMACESLHLISENMKRMEMLKTRNRNISTGIQQFALDLQEFQVRLFINLYRNNYFQETFYYRGICKQKTYLQSSLQF